MISLPGYTIANKLYETSKTVVFRGTTQGQEQPVIIKILQNEYPTLEEIAQVRQEYNIPQQLNSPHVVQTYHLIPYKNSFAIILEDFGGLSLAEFLATENLSILEFLTIALTLVEGLGNIHRLGIIHKDLKPRNIIINPQTKEVKITDFSIAINLPKEQQAAINPNLLQGTLAYIAPEQTGRMNRTLDYRADFYSLGVTFYEMLTGTLPFKSDEPMELVHAHLAQIPTPPAAIKETIPPVISALVMKLLEKNAEDRYQSTEGLKFDLETCLQQLEATGKIEEFELGSRDRGQQLLLPQKLYGREQEVGLLLEAFGRVSQGGREMMLVSGYSGIGKTSIINEVQKPIVAARGYFIGGKFDQFTRDVPYSAIIQAFTELIGQLLTESEEKIALWQAELLATLGDNGQVLIEVIPELELIIGQQPEVVSVGAIEAQNRFNRVFQQFVCLFGKPQHPLVLFLDDLQWADGASLKLIQMLMNDDQNESMLMICAYRDNEVSPLHPFIQTVEKLELSGTLIDKLEIKPLTLENVTQFSCDTLKAEPEREDLQTLTKLIFSKTLGNPFALMQLFKTLYDESLLVYQVAKNAWSWDLNEIQGVGFTDYNIVDLVARNLVKLPQATQNVLKLAACIGDRFQLEELAQVSELSPRATASHLWEALQEGLIIAKDEQYKIPLALTAVELDESPMVQVEYRFGHDRIQQAAYSLIPDNYKEQTHLKIGQLLLENTPPAERQDKIFALVKHLNLGANLLTNREAKYELAELNLMAGQKAKLNAAYEAAFKYFKAGLNLLDKSSWKSRYDLTFSLYLEATEAAYLDVQLETASNLCELTFEQAKSTLDKAKLYQLKIKLLLAQNQVNKALETGLDSLNLLKIDICQQLPDLNLEELGSLPEITNLEQEEALKILNLIFPPACFVESELPLPILYTMVAISRQYGNAKVSPHAYANLGMFVAFLIPDVELAYQLGKLALNLFEKLNAKEFYPRILVSVAIGSQHRKEPISNTIEPLAMAVKSGLEIGDVEYLCHGADYYCYHLFLKGENLQFILDEQKKHLELIKNFEQEHQLFLTKIIAQLVENLKNENGLSSKLVGTFFNEEESLSYFYEINNLIIVFRVYFAKCILSYLARDYAQALADGKEALKYSRFVIPNISFNELNFYYCLSLLASLDFLEDETEKESLLAEVTETQKMIEYWAIHAPMNYQHTYDLVEAEKRRVLGETLAAMEYYDKGINGAKENGFSHHEALGNELAGEFYLKMGREKVARTYLVDAHYAYVRWGATAKVKDLENRYPQYLERSKQKSAGTNTIGTLTSNSSTGSNKTSILDIPALMKASQSISQEILLPQLLETLMHITLENAGADNGILLLRDRNDSSYQLYVEAAGRSDGPIAVLQSIPFTSSENLPRTLINYVLRTKESLVLNDVTEEGRFMKDPYIRQYQPQSVLCTPILYKGELTGLLYLENTIARGAFTRDRLEILQLISSQAAISIENAQLYNTLEAKVVKRTQDLTKAMEDLQNTQKQLVESEKMAALGGLVAGVAHEINTPIGIGVTAASLLAEKATEFSEIYKSGQMKRSQLDKFLDLSVQSSTMVLSNLNRAAELIHSFKQVAVDQSSEAQRTFKVKEYIQECLIPLRPKLRKTAHEIEIQGDENLTMDTYPGALSQIVTNLVMNSLVHAYEPEESGLITFTFEGQKQEVILKYSDNGRGIPPENLSKIFDPFFTTKRGQGGSGLGLHLVYNLVTQKLKGTIRCESQLGEGTTFIIKLPLQVES